MRLAHLIFYAAVAVSFSVHAVGASTPVEVLGRHTASHRGDGAVVMPSLDGQNEVQWVVARKEEKGDCSAAWFSADTGWSPRCERQIVLNGPCVEQCRCTGESSGKVRTGIAYARVDGRAGERWRRVQHSPSDKGRAPPLVGATEAGLVFGNLEVWSPLTGVSLRPPQFAVPDGYSTWYLPKRDAFLRFKPEVTLFSGKGGLYLRSAQGEEERVLPVDTRLLGYYAIETLAPLPGTPLILLGERYLTRGPGSVRFELFDLDSRRILFQEELAEGHTVSDIRVVAGRDGHALFSFVDESAGEHVVVHYGIRKERAE